MPRVDELASLRQTLAEQAEHLDALTAMAESLVRRDAELSRALLHARADLERSEAEAARLRAELAARDHRLGELEGVVFGHAAELRSHELELASAREEAARLGRELAAMTATRAWRLAQSYWRLRDRARRAGRPR